MRLMILLLCGMLGGRALSLDNVSHEEVCALVDIALDDLESSKTLCRHGNYRNSISLAYYSMFSMARALLLIKGHTPKTHRGLINLLGQEYVLGMGFDADLASDFSATHATREKASYAFVDEFTKDEAVDKISLAISFIEECKRFLDEYLEESE